MAVPDDLVASDLTQAIVLAGARHEETIAQFDEGPKRKSKWSECKVFKKGKRWGLPDDKPYKPLPYVDLPIGLMEKEIDQFLREQRLEDLHRKIQAHDHEDVDPDIRPPSPPPVYDKAGNRLNTRDMRIRKAMTAEYNRLVRYMIKHVDGYLPPVDWKPAKLLKKIIIPIEKFPQAPFMGVIIGPRGVNHKRLQETTGCKIFIRGRDIGDKYQSDEEAAMPQHVHIEGDTEEQILMAERLIEPLLNPESAEFEYARTHGMQQLAMVNGFSLNKAEQRCGICGALGHLGFECPETNNQNYKMMNAADQNAQMDKDRKAAEMNKKENVDWKAMAEKKAQMDKDFSDMMNDLGGIGGEKATDGPAAKAPGQGPPPMGGAGAPLNPSATMPPPSATTQPPPMRPPMQPAARPAGMGQNMGGGLGGLGSSLPRPPGLQQPGGPALRPSMPSGGMGMGGGCGMGPPIRGPGMGPGAGGMGAGGPGMGPGGSMGMGGAGMGGMGMGAGMGMGMGPGGMGGGMGAMGSGGMGGLPPPTGMRPMGMQPSGPSGMGGMRPSMGGGMSAGLPGPGMGPCGGMGGCGMGPGAGGMGGMGGGAMGAGAGMGAGPGNFPGGGMGMGGMGMGMGGLAGMPGQQNFQPGGPGGVPKAQSPLPPADAPPPLPPGTG
mmetsp:Transcript_49390/g.117516  ORF Transcript_49390/g.117516 Transcript_49390/m.117516 type:complete len:659 (-) Transcript_49390:119-2095(-)